MNKRDHGNGIADGDGLKGVGEEPKPVGVHLQQVALGNHAENPQQHDPPDQAPVYGGIVAPFPRFQRKGKGNGGTGHKQKQRHNQIPRGKSRPGRMVQVVFEPVGHAAGKAQQRHQRAEHFLPAHNPEHVKAPQHVQRHQARRFFRRHRGRQKGFFFSGRGVFYRLRRHCHRTPSVGLRPVNPPCPDPILSSLQTRSQIPFGNGLSLEIVFHLWPAVQAYPPAVESCG